jgi:enterochelin esterase-like enzyme
LKAVTILLSGCLLILGVFACTPNELPAATSAGFVNPGVPATLPESPTNADITASPKTSPTAVPTATRSPSATPSPTPSPTSSSTPLACWEKGGQVIESQLESEYLKKPLEYRVYLPPCYAEQPERRYPVLYLIHGQTYRNDHWLNLGAADLVDRLSATGEMAPFLMVFPYDRDHYISPPENGFGEAIVADLIPAIDTEFRTLPERADRAIGGISRGGNWAVHIGLQHPEIFGALGAHSTPIFSSDTNPEIAKWLEAIPLERLPRIFMDAGENDRWLQYTLIFEDLLNTENIPHEWHLYPGYHDDDYWQAHLEEYLRWYASPWRESH